MLYIAFSPNIDISSRILLSRLGAAAHPAYTKSYTGQIARYEALKATNIYVLHASDGIDTSTANELLYMMQLKKPIILLDSLQFKKGVPGICRAIIQPRLGKIYIGDVRQLEKNDLEAFIASVAKEPINYVLTNSELTLIKANLRAYFRNLLKARS